MQMRAFQVALLFFFSCLALGVNGVLSDHPDIFNSSSDKRSFSQFENPPFFVNKVARSYTLHQVDKTDNYEPKALYQNGKFVKGLTPKGDISHLSIKH